MLASTLITIALAEYAARDDFKQIDKGSKIRHGIQWLFRAAVVGLACYLDNCLPYAVPLAFLFSAVFRWRLNGLRGKDWRYMAPWSSVYDMCLFALANQWIPPKPYLSLIRTAYSVKLIHRAGTLAYIFEAVVFVVGTVWYICSA